MAVPKRRKSKSQSKKRRSHNSVKPMQIANCPQCHTPTPTHSICPNCGYYQGRVLVDSED